MDEIRSRVEQAQRRLVLRQWAGRLATCLAIAFGVAVLAVAAPKIVAVPDLPDWWNTAWLAGAGAVGFLAATVWTVLRKKTPLEAAVEIDTRFDLRERIASTLALQEDDLETEAGAALAKDARNAIQRVDVDERFRFGLDRRAWWPVAPLAAAVLIAVLAPNRVDAGRDQPTSDQIAAEQARVKESMERARKELAERKKEAEKKGLKEATGLLEDVQKGVEELAKAEGVDKTRALVELNDRVKQLEERRRELGGAKALREQMNRMGSLGKGPAGKAAEAMKRGEWSKALGELSKLQAKMQSGEVSAEQAKQLATQLGKMAEQLSQAAQKNREQIAEVERQMREAQRKGDVARAGELAQKLDRLQQMAPQMQKLAQMADQLGQAQQALQQGDPQQAAEAMGQMQQQLAQMQQEAAAMEMLDGAMTDIEMAKNGMEMEGGGNQGQFGRGGQMGEFGQGMLGANAGGFGGEGEGGAMAPDERNPTQFRDTKVKQNVGRGASTFGGLVDGPSVKGDVVQTIKTELNADTVAPADPLTSERLPRSRREHAEEYFRKLREKL
ncbi:MAG: hypothetical protein AAFV43_05335 [Planctomycetota bacterium]